MPKLDLTTHCALCGEKLPAYTTPPWAEPFPKWCGDQLFGRGSSGSDKPELMCQCTGKERV